MNKYTGHYDNCKCMVCEAVANAPEIEQSEIGYYPDDEDLKDAIRYLAGAEWFRASMPQNAPFTLSYDPGEANDELIEEIDDFIDELRDTLYQLLKGHSSPLSDNVLERLLLAILEALRTVDERTRKMRNDDPNCKCPACQKKFRRLFGEYTEEQKPPDGGRVVTSWVNNQEVSRLYEAPGDSKFVYESVLFLEKCLKAKYEN